MAEGVLSKWRQSGIRMGTVELPLGGTDMVDFMIGLAFVAMVVMPAIVASLQHEKSQGDGL